jgi:hypothetical protein
VVRTSHAVADVADALRDQIAHGRYAPDHLFGDGTAGVKIADVLDTVDPPIQKLLAYDAAALNDGAGELLSAQLPS